MDSGPPSTLEVSETQIPMTSLEPEPANEVTTVNEPQQNPLGLFEKYLSIWVLISLGIGLLLGYYVPAIPHALSYATVAEVSVPIAIALWAMIVPMMMQIDFRSLVDVWKSPKAIFLTSFVNYAIQPFTMFGFAILFLKVIFGSYLGQEAAWSYIVGLIILGGSPCTAMVFCWSTLVNGNPSYILTQVAVNDILILIFYVPTVKLLAGASDAKMPWSTLFISLAFFIVIPLVLGILIRWIIIKKKGKEYLQDVVLKIIHPLSMAALLFTIILIFVYQASTLIGNFIHILIVALPITVQTFFIWGLTYGLCILLRIPFDLAAPATLVAASNFFELAVALTISLYGAQSQETLATVVGVLLEVPLMLALVWINNLTKKNFDFKTK